MKKITLCFCVLTIVISCNNNSEPVVSESVELPQVTVDTPREVKELPLIAKYDCASCHRFDEKFQGPSYLDIASKYSGQAGSKEYLSKKIIEGGSGVWGEIPMAAHSTMPKADVNSIVNYILTLKK